MDGRSGERRWMGGVGREGGWEEWGGKVDGRSGEGRWMGEALGEGRWMGRVGRGGRWEEWGGEHSKVDMYTHSQNAVGSAVWEVWVSGGDDP